LPTTFKNSLKNSPSKWAEQILGTPKNVPEVRNKCLQTIGFEGFDIVREGKRLENFYIQMENSCIGKEKNSQTRNQ
jgi:hypothetical protein